MKALDVPNAEKDDVKIGNAIAVRSCVTSITTATRQGSFGNAKFFGEVAVSLAVAVGHRRAAASSQGRGDVLPENSTKGCDRGCPSTRQPHVPV
jgi:hypothetical protein